MRCIYVNIHTYTYHKHPQAAEGPADSWSSTTSQRPSHATITNMSSNMH